MAFFANTTRRGGNLRLLAVGANDYLTKPLDVKNLLRLLEQIVPTGTYQLEEGAGSHAKRYRPK